MVSARLINGVPLIDGRSVDYDEQGRQPDFLVVVCARMSPVYFPLFGVARLDPSRPERIVSVTVRPGLSRQHVCRLGTLGERMLLPHGTSEGVMFLAERQDVRARLLVFHPETVFTEVAFAGVQDARRPIISCLLVSCCSRSTLLIPDSSFEMSFSFTDQVLAQLDYCGI